ncbi:MAG: SHOCT domain-containing protein [Eggerthellaceae bacterium]|nr:SHOCT domain-containing protein [Eggerthellaceae bacterium]
MTATISKARTAPAILGGIILLLLVPTAYLTYVFFSFVSVYGVEYFQEAGAFKLLIQSIGLDAFLCFVVLPIITAIAAFRRGKGFLAVMFLLNAVGWGFSLWMGINNHYNLGFLIQMGLWILAFLVLFIVCLVGLKKVRVGARSVPWILGLAAMVSCAVQWLINYGGFSTDLVQNPGVHTAAVFMDLLANFLLALGVLFLSAAVGKASKEAAQLADADANARAAAKARAKAEKEAEKAAKKAGKGKKKGQLPDGSATVATATAVNMPAATAARPDPLITATQSSVTGGQVGSRSFGIDPGKKSLELQTEYDPFAAAVADLDAAGPKITLELPTSSKTAAPAPSLSVAAPVSTSAPSAATSKQIKDLQALVDEGILTKAEFESAKAKLL